jgi:hypothetical protein
MTEAMTSGDPPLNPTSTSSTTYSNMRCRSGMTKTRSKFSQIISRKQNDNPLRHLAALWKRTPTHTQPQRGNSVRGKAARGVLLMRGGPRVPVRTEGRCARMCGETQRIAGSTAVAEDAGRGFGRLTRTQRIRRRENAGKFAVAG